jgi:hypothetical protein
VGLRRSLGSVLAAAWLVASAAPALAQVTLRTASEQIPLKAYAEFRRAGVMVLASGTQRDIPTVSDFRSIRVSLTGWLPGRAMVATQKLFDDERAERRLLPIATRKVGVTAFEVRIADFESPGRIAELIKDVGEENGEHVFFFFVLLGAGDDGAVRHYPFKFKVAR